MKPISAAIPVPPRFSWQQTFSALRHPNYRLWFIGQLVSLVGTWMQNTAQGYLVYELTRSPAYLGYVGFAAGIPTWLFTLYGGVIADRISRRALLIITQIAMMLLAFLLAVLVFTGAVEPWHIIVLAFLLGIANAFDAPARQAFVVELVEREDINQCHRAEFNYVQCSDCCRAFCCGNYLRFVWARMVFHHQCCDLYRRYCGFGDDEIPNGGKSSSTYFCDC